MVQYVGEQEMNIYSDTYKDWAGVRPHGRDISHWTMDQWNREINHLLTMIEEDMQEENDFIEYLETIDAEDRRLDKLNLPVPQEEPYESIAESLEIMGKVQYA